MLGNESFDSELKCLKRELKAWESMFERKHARKPNKDDVNSAPEEIKETYTKYRNLRKKAEQMPVTPCQEQDGGDEVFGKGLNKSSQTISSVKKTVRIKTPSNYKPIRLCHGQKPKKTFQEKLEEKTACDENTKTVIPTDRVTTDGKNLLYNDQDEKDVDLGFSITSKKYDSMSKPGLMMGKSKMSQRMKRRSSIASEWLEKNKPDLTDINPIVGQFHDYQPVFISEDSKNVPHQTEFDTDLNNTDFQSPVQCSTVDVDINGEQKDRENHMRKKPEEVERFDHASNKNVDGFGQKTRNFVSTNSLNSDNSGLNKGTNHEKERVANGLKDRKDSGSDASEIRPDFSSSNDLKSKTNKVSNCSERSYPRPATDQAAKRKRNASPSLTDNKMESGDDEDMEENRCKLRKINPDECDNVDDESNDSDGACSSASQATTSKRSSGLVSENFRALNMKARRFSRGPRGTNYGAYKRKLWKQKQQEKENGEQKNTHWKKKSTATSTRRKISATPMVTSCFKCKQEGHWAKDCPGNRPKPVASENWTEPVKAPPDLDVGDKEWQATEDRVQCLTSERLPRPHNIKSDAPPPIEPLYPTENGNPIRAPKEVYNTLKKLGFETFRAGQEEAIMQILCGLSTLVVLSTGAGKSLCYQLPAYMYSKRSPCITLVISPLLSLMEDQVIGLPFGLCGVSLNTNMTKVQRQKAVDMITDGKAAVVIVSPEALVGGSVGPGCLPHVSKLPPIAFACIDEAHCVSEWSHNFRPSYLRVCRVLREKFGVQCLLGLTATATRSTALSVAEHLGIAHRPDAIIRGATIPPNLNLSVSSDTNRDRAILELLQGPRFSNCESIIIYCTRREQTDRLATYLRTCLQKNPINTDSCIGEEPEDVGKVTKGKKRGKKGKTVGKSKSTKALSWQSECYHAGMSAAQRRKVQKMFMSGELRIVVATVAFGMGLDKANVRAIIHYNLPKSFESYVQEIGRAGRDGLPSHCHVFIDREGKDVRELRRHAYSSTVDRKAVKLLVSKIFPKCDCKNLAEKMDAKRAKQLSSYAAEGFHDPTKTPQQQRQPVELMEDDDDDDGLLDQVAMLESNIHQNTSVSRDRPLSAAPLPTAPNQTVACDTYSAKGITLGNANGSAEEQFSLSTNVNTIDNEVPSVGIDINKMNTVEISKQPEATAGVENEMNDCVQAEGCHRVCGGHDVALPIEQSVQLLDMKEESIATLLCYLELHEKKWLRILQPVRSTCTLKFYGGPIHLHYVAQRVPLVTAAIAHAKEQQEFERKTSMLKFPVVEIVDKMGWDLEPARRELYALQWNEGLRLPGESGLSAGHSGIVVEFSDLAFHLRAPGDLSDEERDEVCDFLEDRIKAQERSQVAQLHKVWDTFTTRAHHNCWQSSEECDEKVDGEIKSLVKSYFDDMNDPTKTELTTLTEARKRDEFVKSVTTTAGEEPVNWDSVARDIRSFLSQHSDADLSGRAIARVFHGIDSPCFPAAIWGRDRRFWRRHLDVDFNELRKFAVKELVRFK